MNRLNLSLGGLALAMVLGSGTSVNAQNRDAPPVRPTQTANTPGTTKASTENRTANQADANKPKDEAFAKEAAQGGMAEVKLGQLAQQRGTNQAVKDFGQRMENDHGKANERLKGIAAKQNITLPTTVGDKEQKEYDRLSKLSGEEFDKAYAKEMAQDHEHDISAFKNEASNGQNPDLKQFAQDTLPTLQDHMKQARSMETAVNATKSSSYKNTSSKSSSTGGY